jgi:hypothetical protein
VRERRFLQEIPQMLAVQALGHHSGQPGPHLGLLAVADGVDQQLAQRASLELELAEHVEHLAAQSLPGLGELVQQPSIDVALPSLLGH